MARDNLENIVRIQDFDASPDEQIIIGSSQVIFLMPIFRRVGDHWVDATGDFDLCMSDDGLKYAFTSRLADRQKFAYRWISPYWLANRLQKRGTI